MRPVRFGLIGYGEWGQWHGRCINETAGASLVAVAECTEEGRRAAEKCFGVRTYSSYKELIEEEELDVADIVLPNYLHYEAAITALRAGKNVLLEKPMALRVEECDLILRLARENRAGKKIPVLAIGFELRSSSLWGRVKELIQQGTIGIPRTLNMEIFRFLPEMGSGKWRLNKKKAGSWILDGPVHYFDLIRWYFQETGEPQSIYSVANSLRERALIDNFSSIIRFPNESYATLSYTMGGYGHYITAKIMGNEGAIRAHWEGVGSKSSEPKFYLEYGRNKAKYQVPIERPAGEIFDLKAEIEQVVRAVREGSAVIAAGKDGREAVRLCLAAERSLEAGEIIKL